MHDESTTPHLDRSTVDGLVKVVRDLSSSRDLATLLSLFVDAITEVAGFECAAINLVVDSGDLEVVAVTGPAEIKDALLGEVSTRAAWDLELARSERRGAVYLDLGDRVESDLATWVSSDDAWYARHEGHPRAWRPEYALWVPMAGPDNELIGVISVDMPRSGLVPSDAELAVLELLAREAETAILATQPTGDGDIFGAVFETAGSPMCIISIDGTLMQTNASFRSTFGDVPDVAAFERRVVNVEGTTSVTDEVRRVTQNPTQEQTLVLAVADGDNQRWYQVSARAVMLDGEYFDRAVCSLTDITSERIKTQRYRHESEHDSLTGLLNRRGVTGATPALSNGAVPGQLLVAMFCDLDNFKQANDQHGHGVGDDVLVSVAEQLRLSVPDVSLVGRVGGDEFVILSRCDTLAEAEDMAEQVVQRVAANLPGRLDVTASVGLAHDVAGGDRTYSDLMGAADQALFRAKTSGKGRWLTAV